MAIALSATVLDSATGVSAQGTETTNHSNITSPIWEQAGTVNQETVLFRQDAEGQLYADLLFPAEQILEVEMANKTQKSPADSCRIVGNRLFISGDIPFLTDAEIYPKDGDASNSQPHIDGKTRLAYGERDTFHARQVNVTYTSKARWNGPIPESDSDQMEAIWALAEKKKSLNLVVLGDSISVGCNASGTTPCAPFQKPYPELVQAELERLSGVPITLTNLSKSGMSVFWGETQIAEVMTHDPDVVVIAFGMNDASSSMSVTDFQIVLARMVDAIHAAKPSTKIVFVSGMTPNPEWVGAEMDKRGPFHQAMRDVAAKTDSVFADVYSVWTYIVSKKGVLSLTGNGVNHPNDYGHRIYSDVLTTALRPDSKK